MQVLMVHQQFLSLVMLQEKHQPDSTVCDGDAVDGRHPAPPGMYQALFL